MNAKVINLLRRAELTSSKPESLNCLRQALKITAGEQPEIPPRPSKNSRHDTKKLLIEAKELLWDIAQERCPDGFFVIQGYRFDKLCTHYRALDITARTP